jgi:hypothetical protein
VVVVLISIGVFVLPGYALVRLVLPRGTLSLAEGLCLACGASLALYPLLLLGLTLLGVGLSPTIVVALIALSAAFIVADATLLRRCPRAQKSISSRADARSQIGRKCLAVSGAVSVDEILLFVVFVATVVLRLSTVHGQSYPPWTDGYHHTLISQIIRDTGFIPQGYRPYAPIDRFTYHFGFHTIVAVWAWLTGMATPKATLLVGQIINALSVPALYLFARMLTGRKDVGLLTAVVVGLVSMMPAYYINWSRDTQLTANAILPVALVALVQVVEAPAAHRRWGVLGAILLAGLFLAHYAIWAFAAVFMLVYLAVWAMTNRQSLGERLRRLGWLAGSALAGVVLVSPWMWHMVVLYLLPRQIMATEAPTLSESEIQAAIAGYYGAVSLPWMLSTVIRPLQAVLAYLGTLVGIVTQRRVVLVLLGWFGLLFVVATPEWTGLPYGLVLYNNFAVAIALYLAFAVFIALLAATVIDWFGARCPKLRPVLLLATVVLAGAMAWRWQPALLGPDQVYMTAADETAAEWISENVPAEATIAIRPYFPTPGEVIGVDGGYWLPYLSGRQVTVPPMIYYADGTPEYVNEVLNFSKAMLRVGSVAELVNLLRSRNITYVYIGCRHPDNQRRILLDSPQFEAIYDRDGTTVFRLRESQ